MEPASNKVRREKRGRIKGPPQRSLAPGNLRFEGVNEPNFRVRRLVIRVPRPWRVEPKSAPDCCGGRGRTDGEVPYTILDKPLYLNELEELLREIWDRVGQVPELVREISVG